MYRSWNPCRQWHQSQVLFALCKHLGVLLPVYPKILWSVNVQSILAMLDMHLDGDHQVLQVSQQIKVLRIVRHDMGSKRIIQVQSHES